MKNNNLEACKMFIGKEFRLAGFVLACLVSSNASTAPVGGQVVGGTGNIQQSGSATTINQSTQNMAINWQSFDVQANELVQFNQPNSNALALNRILDQNPSQIFGRIDANGNVLLVNPRGIIFGQSAVLNVGSVIASTLDINPDKFMNGDLSFAALEGADGMVINQGIINAATGGSVTLMGNSVVNEGMISAHLGSVNLAAGETAVLTFDADGMIGVEVTQEVLTNEIGVKDAVLNSGEIKADGGDVLLTAKVSQNLFTNVVNNSGILRAASIVERNGKVFLSASGGDVNNSGVIDVSAQAKGVNGGDVTLQGVNINTTGVISADALDGDGGIIHFQSDDTTLLSGSSETSAASSANGVGGQVKVLGFNVGLFDLALIDASGALGGGEVLVGGDFQGGNLAVDNAWRTIVAPGAFIDASATVRGDGGKVIVWADDTSWYYGVIDSLGGEFEGNGGFVEVSGKQNLAFDGLVNLAATLGEHGQLLLDPVNITIVDGASTTLPPDVTFSDNVTSPDITDAAINAALASGNLRLEANNDIDISGGVVISSSTTSSLELIARDHIDFNGTVQITLNEGQTGAQRGALTLTAEFNDANTTGDVDFNDNNVTINTNGGGFNVSGDRFQEADNVTLSVGDAVINALRNNIRVLGNNVNIGSISATTGSGDVQIVDSVDSIVVKDITATSEIRIGAQDDITVTGTLDAGSNFVRLEVGQSDNGGTVDLTDATFLSNLLVSGAGGVDTLVGLDTAISWNIAEFVDVSDAIISPNEGDFAATSGSDPRFSGTGFFENVENLEGSSGVDTFLFTATGYLTGYVNGGANGDSFTFSSPGFASATNVFGDVGVDSFTFNNTAFISGNLDAGEDGDQITFAGSVLPVAGGSSVIGGDGDDTLTLASGFTAFVALNSELVYDGGAHTATIGDTFDFTQASGEVIVTLANDRVFNVEEVKGAGDDDTLVDTRTAGGTWTVYGDGVGCFGAGQATSRTDCIDTQSGVHFEGIANLTGGDGADNFIFVETPGIGTIAGSIDAGNGANVINLMDTATAGTQRVGGGITTGVDGDQITVGTNVVVVGAIVTDDGNDSVTVNGQVNGAVDLGVASTATTDNDTLIVNSAAATSIGDAVTAGVGNDDFTLTAGTLAGTVSGGDGNDDFFLDGATVTGLISGDAGLDRFDINAVSSNLLLDGGTQNDTFNFMNDVSGTSQFRGDAGNDVFNIADGVNLVTDITDPTPNVIEGGADTDTINMADFSIDVAGTPTAVTGQTIELAWDLSTANGGSVSDTAPNPVVDGFADVENITGSAGVDTFTFSLAGDISGTLDGQAGADVFQLDTVLSGTASLVGGADNDRFNINANLNAATTLEGNGGDDEFHFQGSIIAANAGALTIYGGDSIAPFTDNDTADLANYSLVNDAGVVVDLQNNLIGIDTVVGNAMAGSELIGPNQSNTWSLVASPTNSSVTYTSTGPVTVSFRDFETVTGGILDDDFTIDTDIAVNGNDGNDTFRVNTSVTQTLSGDNDNDTFIIANAAISVTDINGGALANDPGGNPPVIQSPGDTLDFSGFAASEIANWTFSAFDSGQVTGTTATFDVNFSGIESLVGIPGPANDNVAVGISFFGLHDLSGDVTLDFSGATNQIDVDLALYPTVTNVIGGDNPQDILRDTDTTGRVWNVLGENSGNVDGAISFSSIENLIGGDGVDTFNFAAAGYLSGTQGVVGGGTASVDVISMMGTGAADEYTVPLIWNDVGGASGNVRDLAAVIPRPQLIANFADVESFIGGDGGNDFNIVANLPVAQVNLLSITGGTGTDVLSFANFTNAVDYNLNDLSGFESIVGGQNGNDILRGDNADNTWTLDQVVATETNPGRVCLTADCVNTEIAFNGFEILQAGTGVDIVNIDNNFTGDIYGGLGADQFTLLTGVIHTGSLFGDTDNALDGGADDTYDIAGTVTGNVFGGLGADTITISGTVDGNVFGDTGVTLDGGGADTIAFSGAAGSVSGNVNAGPNDEVADTRDTLDYGAATFAPAPTVDVANASADGIGGTFIGFENFVGQGVGSTLIGDNANNTWIVTGVTDCFGIGIADCADETVSITFSGFQTVNGGSGNDVFDFSDGVVETGFGGGAGDDTFDFSDYTGPASVSVNDLITASIENVDGSSTSLADVLSATGGAFWTITSQHSGSVTIGTDTVDYTAYETLTGDSAATDTLTVSAGSYYDINANGGGCVVAGTGVGGCDTSNGTLFNNFNAIDAADDANDTFVFGVNGRMTSINGGTIGSSTNRMDASAFADNLEWDFTTANDGTLSNLVLTADITGFTAINDIQSGTGNDDFLMVVDFNGDLDANLGRDTLNYSAASAAVDKTFADIEGANSTGFEVVVGSGTAQPNIITAADVSNSWTVDGNGACLNGGVSCAGGILFQGFQTLVGGAVDDTFTITAAVANIDGGTGINSYNISGAGQVSATLTGSGTDTLDASGFGTTSLQWDNLAGSVSGFSGSLGQAPVGNNVVAGFTNIESLVSADGNDVFNLSASGTILGFSGLTLNAGQGIDALSFEAYTTNVNVNIGDYTGFEEILGSTVLVPAPTTDTITAGDIINTWTITGDGAGCINGTGASCQGGTSFRHFENLRGGSEQDTFDFLLAGASISGTASGRGGDDIFNVSSTVAGILAGDGGSDQFILSPLAQVAGGIQGGSSALDDDILDASAFAQLSWRDLDVDAGIVAETGAPGDIASFSGIETITSGAGDDTFLVLNNSAFDGTINAGLGYDAISFETFTTNVNVNIGDYTGFEEIRGSTSISPVTVDTITAGDAVNTWHINADGSGCINGNPLASCQGGTAFLHFENFTGGLNEDTFNVAATDTVFNTMNGNDGIDTFNISGNVTGDILGGADGDIFNISNVVQGNINGGAGADLFVLSPGAGVLGGQILGGTSASDVDTVDASAYAQLSWTGLSGSSGTVSDATVPPPGTITGFTEIESIISGAGADSFELAQNSNFLGSIDAGAGNDSLSYAQYTDRVVVDLASFSGFTDIVGGSAGDDEIQGSDFDNTWTILGPANNAASVTLCNDAACAAPSTITFEGFEIITGGTSVDQFDVFSPFVGNINGSDGADIYDIQAAVSAVGLAPLPTGSLDGGDGIDTFIINAAVAGDVIGGLGADVINITATAGVSVGGTVYGSDTAGSITDGNDTITVGNLVGGVVAGAGNDQIAIVANGLIDGSLNGGGGDDSLSYASYSPGPGPFSVFVDVSGGQASAVVATISGVENFTGANGGANDNFTGPVANSAWNFTAADAATIDTIGTDYTFTGFENFTGGSQDDSFNLAPNILLTGTVDGGGQISTSGDVLNYGNFINAVTIVREDLNNIETVIGGVGVDTLLANTAANLDWAVGANNSGSVVEGVNDLDFQDIENLSGGSGVDTFTVSAGINQLSGNNGADVFFINNGAVVASVDGGGAGADIDRMSYANRAGQVDVNLQTFSSTDVASFSNIEAIDGGVGNGDTFTSANGTNVWLIDTANSGRLAGIAFAGFEQLNGGTGADDFRFADTINFGGSINGGVGLAEDVLDYSQWLAVNPVQVNLGDLVEIERVRGGQSGNDTLAAPNDNTGRTWIVVTQNAGTVNDGNGDIAFEGFENLQGGNGVDTIDVAAPLDGNINAGANDDVIDISSSLGGNLLGAAGNDRFNINPNGQIFGVVNGGSETDTLSYTNYPSAVSVNLADGSASRINNDAGGGVSLVENFEGSGAGNDQFQGRNIPGEQLWSFTNINEGTVDAGAQGIAGFVDFENFIGGNGNDRFSMMENAVIPAQVGSISGSIDGGLGNNILDYSDWSAANTVSVNFGVTEPHGATGVPGFSNIDLIIAGASTADALNAADLDNTWELNSANSGSYTADAWAGDQLVRWQDFEVLNGGTLADNFIYDDGVTYPGTVNGGGGNDTLDFSRWLQGLDIIATNYVGFSGIIGTSFVDTIRSGDGDNVWTISGADRGDVNGFTFAEFEVLVGGIGNDTFNYTTAQSSISNSISGGDGGGVDEMNFSAFPNTVTVNLGLGMLNGQTPIAGMESFVGSAGSSDSLLAPAATNLWQLTGGGAGSISSDTGGPATVVDFAGFELAQGNNGGDDTFAFMASAETGMSLSGGNGGTDILDYQLIATDVTYNSISNSSSLTNGVQGFEGIIGSQSNNDLLISDNTANTWTIDGPNSGNLDGFSFEQLENLQGGTGRDDFLVSVNGALDGFMWGGAQVDTLTVTYTEGVSPARILNFDAGANPVVSGDSVTLLGTSVNDDSQHVYNSLATNTLSSTVGNQVINSTDVEVFDDQLNAPSAVLSGSDAQDVMRLTAPGDVLSVSVDNFDTVVNLDNKDTINLAGGAAQDLLDIDGDINIGGVLNIETEQVSNSSGSRITVDRLNISNAQLVGDAGNRLLITVSDLQLSALTGDAFISESDTLTLQQSDIEGDFNLWLESGNLISNGPLTVGGDSLFTGIAGSDMILTDPANSFTGSVGFVASNNRLGDVNVSSGGAIQLGDVESGSLTVISAGDVTDAGLLDVSGVTSLDVSADVNLDSNNDLGQLDVINANNASINEATDIMLGNINVVAGFNLTAQGRIVDGNGAAVNITANQVDLTAQNGMGMDDSLETAVAVLSVTNVAEGNIEIDNTSPVVTVASAVNAGVNDGDIRISQNGDLVIGGDVTAAGEVDFRDMTAYIQDGNVVAETGVTISASNVTLNADLTAAAAGVSISASGGDVVQNGDVNAGGNINVSAAQNVAQNGDLISSDTNARISVTAANGTITMADRTTTYVPSVTSGDQTARATIAYEAEGTIVISSLDADFAGGRIDVTSRTGDILSSRPPNRSLPNVTGNVAQFVAREGTVGEPRSPMVINVPGFVIIQAQTSAQPIFLVRTTFLNDSRILFNVAEAKAEVGGSQRTEVDALAIIDPAIFTQVRNFREDEYPLKLPADQLYEEEDERKGGPDPDIFEQQQPYDIDKALE